MARVWTQALRDQFHLCGSPNIHFGPGFFKGGDPLELRFRQSAFIGFELREDDPFMSVRKHEIGKAVVALNGCPMPGRHFDRSGVVHFPTAMPGQVNDRLLEIFLKHSARQDRRSNP